MTKWTASLPSMYADHHVLIVREVLSALAGVSQIEASSARKQVTLTYDESKVTPERISSALSAAGYVPGSVPTFPASAERNKDGSSWHTILPRVTVTTSQD